MTEADPHRPLHFDPFTSFEVYPLVLDLREIRESSLGTVTELTLIARKSSSDEVQLAQARIADV